MRSRIGPGVVRVPARRRSAGWREARGEAVRGGDVVANEPSPSANGWAVTDGQYADAEYPEHVGWGHSALGHSLSFARRAGAERTVLFHHDPLHSDEFLDRLDAEAREAWAARGGGEGAIELAVERAEYELPAAAAPAASPAARAGAYRYIARAMPSPAIDAAAAESELIRRALAMADSAHEGQVRNGSGGMAYIHHPVAVAELLAEHGYGEETVAAALLHDVVEDSELTLSDVEAAFGPRVAGLVAVLTDDESVEPYGRRKEIHRQHVEVAGGDALAIYAADKLSNVSVLRRAYASEGEKLGEEFKAPLDDKEAIWRADLAMLRRRAPELPFLDELEAELDRFTATRDRRARTARI